MCFPSRQRRIPFSVPVLALVAALGACGQKGPLHLPDTPAAAQRATLPQTIFGGSATDAPATRSVPAEPPSSVLPNLPDIR